MNGLPVRESIPVFSFGHSGICLLQEYSLHETNQYQLIFTCKIFWKKYICKNIWHKKNITYKNLKYVEDSRNGSPLLQNQPEMA
jgi:hypothetical protein